MGKRKEQDDTLTPETDNVVEADNTVEAETSVKVKALMQVQMPNKLIPSGEVFDIADSSTLEYLLKAKAVVRVKP